MVMGSVLYEYLAEGSVSDGGGDKKQQHWGGVSRLSE